MKKLLPLLLIGLALAILEIYTRSYHWQEFPVPGGQSSIMMPLQPTPYSRTKQSELGSLTTRSYVVKTEVSDTQFAGSYTGLPVEFAVSYTMLPAEMERSLAQVPTEVAIDGLRDNELYLVGRFGGGTLLRETPVVVDGTAGREALFALPHWGGYQLRGRFFLVNHKFYQVFVVLHKAEIYGPDANKFIDSFHLN